MTPDQVRDLAGTLLRPVLGDENVEDIVVREDDDWSGEPALYIDVLVEPSAGVPDGDQWLTAKRTLLDRLVANGDKRFPYISLTDREEKRSEALEEAGPAEPE